MSEELEEEYFPERINVTKVISYNVEKIIDQIHEDNRDSGKEIKITLNDVIEMITEMAKDDFSCGWGHRTDVSDLIFQDEAGDEY
jgi:hypothetical protein